VRDFHQSLAFHSPIIHIARCLVSRSFWAIVLDEEERPMKVWMHPLGDASFHLFVLVCVAVLAFALRAAPPRAMSAGPGNHPANCHACRTIPRGATAEFEAFLVRSGCIDDPREGE
jgi:hypothetical protein